MIIVQRKITDPNDGGGGGGGGGGGRFDPPVIIPDYGFGMELIDTRNQVWDLARGPAFALAGASGFGTPDVENWWRSTPAMNGSIYLGGRVPHRELTLPIEIRGDDSDKWLAADRLFWKGVIPGSVMRLRVTTPDAQTRYLPVRYAAGGSPELDIDPMLQAQSIYSLSLVAADPYWYGEHVETIFESVADNNLFPGPPFNINSASTIATGTISNPGNAPAWPSWTITGPYTTVSVGVGGNTVALGTAISTGQSRIVDTDPSSRSIRDGNGVDKWLEGTSITFAEIPPGSDVPLTMSVTGAAAETTIRLSFDARYRRAW